MGLIYRKFMTNWKLYKKSSKSNVAGCCSFLRLEMAWVWSKTLQIEKSANLFVFSIHKFDRYIFLHDATQGFQSYLISMSKLNGFKFSLTWRWEQVFNSMPLISTIWQVKTWKSSNEFSKSWHPVFILMPFLNGWSQDNQHGLIWKIFHRASKWS